MSFRKNPRPGTIVIRTFGNKYYWRTVIKNDGTDIHYKTNSKRAIYERCALTTWEQWCVKYKAITIDTFIKKFEELDKALWKANMKLDRLKK